MSKTIFVCKPSTLTEVKDGIAEHKRFFDSKGGDYYVAEERQLSNQEWQEFTNSFLIDREWISDFCAKEYTTNGKQVPCIRVTCPGSEIALIVDPQGFDYARYVGIETADSSEIEEDDSSEIEEDYEEDYEEDLDEDLEREPLTEDEVVDGLRALLMGDSLDCTLLDNADTATYEQGGYLTYDKGFTIRTADGSVFQITVKQER